MKRLVYCFVLMVILVATGYGQDTGPWNSPIMWAEEVSPDLFSIPRVLQDSSGVPSMDRKPNTDSIFCVFQWFRKPRPSPTWDRVAVKISSDDGLSWANPTPIVINGLPDGYQRPFDPTIVFFKDSVRLYFSSSVRMPTGGLDSLVNTYSAVGTDGINYQFEPGARFDIRDRPVIDPAVAYCPQSLEAPVSGPWRLTAPIGAPQDGAYQATSFDGLNWNRINNIVSDNTHNWTGNILPNESGTMNFYGSGPTMWRAQYSGAGEWFPPVTIGLRGGDPSVISLRRRSAKAIVYVGPRYVTSVDSDPTVQGTLSNLFPNPVYDILSILNVPQDVTTVVCVDYLGRKYSMDVVSSTINTQSLAPGGYVVCLPSGEFLGRFIRVR